MIGKTDNHDGREALSGTPLREYWPLIFGARNRRRHLRHLRYPSSLQIARDYVDRFLDRKTAPAVFFDRRFRRFEKDDDAGGDSLVYQVRGFQNACPADVNREHNRIGSRQRILGDERPAEPLQDPHANRGDARAHRKHDQRDCRCDSPSSSTHHRTNIQGETYRRGRARTSDRGFVRADWVKDRRRAPALEPKIGTAPMPSADALSASFLIVRRLQTPLER